MSAGNREDREDDTGDIEAQVQLLEQHQAATDAATAAAAAAAAGAGAGRTRGIKRARERGSSSDEEDADDGNHNKGKKPAAKKRRLVKHAAASDDDGEAEYCPPPAGGAGAAKTPQKSSKKSSGNTKVVKDEPDSNNDDSESDDGKSRAGGKKKRKNVKSEPKTKTAVAATKSAKAAKGESKSASTTTTTKQSILKKRKNAQEIQAKSRQALLSKPKGLPRVVPMPVFGDHATAKQKAEAEALHEATLELFQVDFNLPEDKDTAMYNPGNIYRGFRFVAETTAGPTLAKMTAAVAKKMLPNFELECTPSGISLQSRNMNAVGWCMATVGKDLFEHYYCPEPFTMVLDPVSFSNKLKEVKSNTVLRLLVAANDVDLHIEIVNRTNGINALLTEHQIDDNDSGAEHTRYGLNDIPTAFMVCLDPQLLKTVCMMLATLEGGDKVTIVVDKDNLSFVINMCNVDEQRITIDNRFSGELATLEVKSASKVGKASKGAGAGAGAGAAKKKKKAAAASAAGGDNDNNAEDDDDDKELSSMSLGGVSSLRISAGAIAKAAGAGMLDPDDGNKSSAAASAGGGGEDGVVINDDGKKQQKASASSAVAKLAAAEKLREAAEDAEEEKERRRQEALAGVQIVGLKGSSDDEQIQSTYSMKNLLELLIVMIKIKQPINMLINKNDNDVLLVTQSLGLHCGVRYVLEATAGPATDLLS